MRIGDVAIYEGTQHFIVGEAIAQEIQEDNGSIFHMAVAVNRVEHARLKGLTLATWVSLKDVSLLPSSIHFQQTEWYLGMTNGN